ncbi:MAG TPA: hypothetical protein VN668_13850 [Stellaceae bacterium]|nr:hypothetical protein [Stellaceae bacterium]
MSQANIGDRNSIERIYPRAVFLREANANSRAKASVLRGLSILSSPDTAGDFSLVRAAQHAGEREAGEGAVFLCPFAQATSRGAEYPTATAGGAAAEDADPYAAFITRVLETARTAQLPEPTGLHDPRLKGLRQ